MRYMYTSPIKADGELGLFKEAIEIIVHYERAGTQLLKSRLSVGYARAARLMDQLEILLGYHTELLKP